MRKKNWSGPTSGKRQVIRMGINVRVQNFPKTGRAARAGRADGEKDGMGRRVASESSRRWVKREHVEKRHGPDRLKLAGNDLCEGCPYRQTERYCFPCMKKILEEKRKGTERTIVLKQEEKRDGQTY